MKKKNDIEMMILKELERIVPILEARIRDQVTTQVSKEVLGFIEGELGRTIALEAGKMLSKAVGITINVRIPIEGN